LNIDHFYQVDHFVQPGETINSGIYRQACGGKGLNQSIALAHAGSQVFHAGKIGWDGKALTDCLEAAGINTQYVEKDEYKPSGHAIIQVNKEGQNSIIIHGGTNRAIQKENIKRTLGFFKSGDILLLQNEVSEIPRMIDLAKNQGMSVFFNPAPMDEKVLEYPLDKVDYFFVNEIEGAELTMATNPDAIIKAMRKQFPRSATILTLGENGVIYADPLIKIFFPAVNVKPVDTTAAGDTFIGFFIAELIKGQSINSCLEIATRAAAICVTRHGAADSIPLLEEVVPSE
jgi:ribokinase